MESSDKEAKRLKAENRKLRRKIKWLKGELKKTELSANTIRAKARKQRKEIRQLKKKLGDETASAMQAL